MIWIDLENKLPTDADVPENIRWTQKKWDAWLVKSKELIAVLAQLDADGKLVERNAQIDANSAHWGKLKEWLLFLSYGKCWFSEVRELYSHYDVEHFRPKKEAKAIDAAVRDGYWWLAFNYMNFRACGNVGNRKKGGWFPLKDGSHCSTHAAQCEEAEEPYLLDPVDAEDVALLAFDEEGKAVPMPNASEWEVLRVTETVKRLKLNEHTPLAEERRKVWSKVSQLIDDYHLAKTRCSQGNNPVAKEKLSAVRTKVRELTSPKAELSAVARWCIILRNDQVLSRLLA